MPATRVYRIDAIDLETGGPVRMLVEAADAAQACARAERLAAVRVVEVKGEHDEPEGGQGGRRSIRIHGLLGDNPVFAIGAGVFLALVSWSILAAIILSMRR